MFLRISLIFNYLFIDGVGKILFVSLLKSIVIHTISKMIKGVLDYRGETEYKLLMDEDLSDMIEVGTLPVGDFSVTVGG